MVATIATTATIGMAGWTGMIDSTGDTTATIATADTTETGMAVGIAIGATDPSPCGFPSPAHAGLFLVNY